MVKGDIRSEAFARLAARSFISSGIIRTKNDLHIIALRSNYLIFAVLPNSSKMIDVER